MDEPSLSQDSFSSLLPPDDTSLPVTPDPPHATLPDGVGAALNKMQSSLADASNHITPPPSTQVPSSQRVKTRTPTPTVSHISTPPPTIEMPTQTQQSRMMGAFATNMTTEQIASASLEELRTKVTEIQAALQEAKMSAAHHKLQYQMLVQESAAAIDRMRVEAQMAQYENEVIHTAEQARAAATPAQPSPFQEGMILVQKDLYQRMCREIRELTDERGYLGEELAAKDRQLIRQDMEIASLTDKVMFARERIREHRETVNRHRRSQQPPSIYGSTPRSTYHDPLRSGVSSQEQPQPFAALLQASEMASQEARQPMGARKCHTRNTHSLSSLPATPHHSQKTSRQQIYHTPSGRQPPLKVPSTAPVPRTSAMRTPDIYTQHSLPVPRGPAGPTSDDGTVSAHEDSDHEDAIAHANVDYDSEAETEILEQDTQDTISESQASRAASQMLRGSQEDARVKRDSFKGSGMLGSASVSGSQHSTFVSQGREAGLKQTRLFGPVRKAGVERGAREGEGNGEERPRKRARTGGEGIGLGIAGVIQ